jgi:hypothetical protein
MSHDPNSIRVLTVDDHALLREGIALVNAESDMTLVTDRPHDVRRRCPGVAGS